MVRRISSSQFRSQMRSAQNQLKRNLNKYNSAVNQYNRAIRQHNSQVKRNRARINSELRRLNSSYSTKYTVTVVEILMLVMRQMYHFDEDIVSHKNAAAAYMALRDKYKSLIADIIKATLAVPEITKQRDGLLSEYQLISKLSLPTDDKDYPEALTRLKLREDDQNIWSDAQIDHLLPVELRRK